MNTKVNKALKRRWTRRSMVLSVLSLVAIAGISYAAINTRMQDDPIHDQPTYEVQQGPLTISVTVSGSIQAREKVVIKNELEGSSTILYLVPEGTRVKQGELLVDLDVSNLIDQRVDQEIKVQNADAAYISARENLAIVESQAKSDIDKAQLTYDFAMQDLKKYREGEYPKLVKEAQTQISTRQEELNLAKEKVKWSRVLFDEKYLSQSELQTDELSAYRSQNNLDLSKSDLDLLENYTYKRQIAQLVSDVTQAEMALERMHRQANANIIQASATLQAKLSEFNQEKNKLQKINDQIGKAKIYAPMDGLVVYFTSVSMGMGRRGSQEPLEEGQMVRERQELIHLPTTSSYMVVTKIPEPSLEKIHIGLPVRITIDALPGKVLTGKVTSIGPLPDAQDIFMNPDLKVYNAQINIDGDGNDLRSGMGCQTEIIVDYFPDTTYVPIEAVLRVGGKPTVFVANGNKWAPRTVDLGPDNNRLAQIKSGLKKGEIVLLTPPLSSAEVSDEDWFNQVSDIPQILEESKQLQIEPTNSAPSQTGRTGGPGGDPSSPRGGRANRGIRSGSGGPDAQNMTPEEREAMRSQRPQNREEAPRQGNAGQP